MAKVIVTLKLMPDSPEVDLSLVKDHARKLVEKYGAQYGKDEMHPVAFGLKALHLILIVDEEQGSTDKLEAQLKTIQGVQSVEVIDVRRALG
ncbi:elongation factor 1-beta [Candidatus Woesearchaeota archaeon]|nr:elongation factor 1-beta [Candidatus Woesearchaeota archaeon]